MPDHTRTIEKLLRQQAALANFGSFAFREATLEAILTEAARICAESLGVPFAKICRYRAETNDLMIDAGYGWRSGVVGCVVSAANESSTQGRAFVTGEPVIVEDLARNNSYKLPAFYAAHEVVATVDVLIKGKGNAWGVLEVDSARARKFDRHDIDFLTGFANVVAEAVATSGRVILLQQALAEKDKLLSERIERELRIREINRNCCIWQELTPWARCRPRSRTSSISRWLRSSITLARRSARWRGMIWIPPPSAAPRT